MALVQLTWKDISRSVFTEEEGEKGEKVYKRLGNANGDQSWGGRAVTTDELTPSATQNGLIEDSCGTPI